MNTPPPSQLYTIQTVINQSRSFVEVWQDLEKWIEEKKVGTNENSEPIKSLCFITDGYVFKRYTFFSSFALCLPFQALGF